MVCVETRHMQAVLRARINKTERNDARGMAQMMRVGIYRPSSSSSCIAACWPSCENGRESLGLHNSQCCSAFTCFWENAMPKRRQSPQSSRRNFLKGASLLGAVGAVTPPVAAGAIPVAPLEKLMAAVPGPRQMAAETMAHH